MSSQKLNVRDKKNKSKTKNLNRLTLYNLESRIKFLYIKLNIAIKFNLLNQYHKSKVQCIQFTYIPEKQYPKLIYVLFFLIANLNCLKIFQYKTMSKFQRVL